VLFFHLLVQEAVQKWDGSAMARFGLERRFEHKTMKEVSNSILRGKWHGWSAPSLVVPSELQSVASVYVDRGCPIRV
jgi:hypothetical protein